MYQYADLEYKIIELVQNAVRRNLVGHTQGGKFILGGSAGPNGGTGGPWLAPVGQLPQTLVCYDTTEAANPGFVGSGLSLLDNLNHIRAGSTIVPNYTPVNYTITGSGTLIDHLYGIDDKLDEIVASGWPGFGEDLALVDVSPESPGTLDLAARVDHKHYLSEAITPTWTGKHVWQPSSNAVDVLKVLDSAGSSTVFQVDTTNQRVGVKQANPSTVLGVAEGEDVYAVVGKASLGFVGHGNHAGFAHNSCRSTGSYALLQNSSGDTFINAASGRTVFIRNNNQDIMRISPGPYQWSLHRDNTYYYQFGVDTSGVMRWVPSQPTGHVRVVGGGGDQVFSVWSAYETTKHFSVNVGGSNPYVSILGSSAAQLALFYDTDSYVNFTVDSGSSLTIKPAESGGVLVRPTTNNTETFRVQNSSGNTILQVDSQNRRVGINGAPSYPLHITMGSYATAFVVTDAGGQDAAVLDTFVPSLTLYSHTSNAFLSVETNGSGESWLQFLDSSVNYGWRLQHKASNNRLLMRYSGGMWQDYHVFDSSRKVGFNIGDSTPGAMLEVRGTSEQLRLSYDSDSYASFTVGSNSTLTITPAESGGVIIKPTTDNSGAFKLQNAAGTDFLAFNSSTPALNLSVSNSGSSLLNINQTNTATSGNTRALVISQTLTMSGAGSTPQNPVQILAYKTDNNNSTGWTYMCDARYYNQGAGTITYVTGYRAHLMINDSAGVLSNVLGFFAAYGSDGSSSAGSITNAVGFQASPQTQGSTTISTLRGFHVNPANLAASSVTTMYAFSVGAMSGKATTPYAFYAQDGHVVLNDDGGDFDVRIEGDTDANLFFLDANVNRIGIGTNSPAAKLHALSTSEQFRLGYDASNFVAFTVSSSGVMTLWPNGNAGFAFERSTIAKFTIQSADTLHKSIYLTDTSSNEIWEVAHRTHAQGNMLSFAYNNGTSWTTVANFSIGGYLAIGRGLNDGNAILHVGTLGVSGYPLYPTAALIVTGADAEIGSVSTTGGSWGSAFSLVEMDASTYAFQNVWNITRKTSGGSPASALHFNYGTSNNWSTNAVKATLTTDGYLGLAGVSSLLSGFALDCRGPAHIGSTAGPTYPAHGTDILSGHQGIGGFRFWNFDGVDGTARTIINDATGDVAYSLFCSFAVRSSDSVATGGVFTIGPGGTYDFTISSGNTIRFACSSGGAFTVQRTAGSLTYKIALLVIWI